MNIQFVYLKRVDNHLLEIIKICMFTKLAILDWKLLTKKEASRVNTDEVLTHCPLFVAHGCLLTVLHCYHPPLPKAFIVAFCLCKTFSLPLNILYLDQFQIK